MIHERPSRVAIYARYSADIQNPSSVDDQVALCRKAIADHFGDVDVVTVFSDAAVSGTTLQRPGIKRLLDAVGRRHIDLVVAEGLDRLSRSLKDIAAMYETLAYHKAGIWTVHEGKINELHIGLKGTMNSLMLRDMKARVKRGHRGKIAAGLAASSCTYGYRVVRGVVDGKGRNVNGVREIDEAAAAVIRRVYKEYIAGKPIAEIIEGLNRDGIPAPAGGLWKRNAIMGGAEKAEGILRNEVYTGKLVFGKSHVVRDPVTNRKRQILNPPSEWIKQDVPHLRIISDKEWEAVRLLDQPKEPAPRKSRLPEILNTHNQHALTGWIKCGQCGGSKSLANETRYLCSNHRYAKTCSNSRGTKEATLLDATFQAILKRLAEGPDIGPLLKAAFSREMARQKRLAEKEVDLGERIGRLVNAIEAGVDVEVATQRILDLQDELRKVQAERQAQPNYTLPSEAEIRDQMVRLLRDIRHEASVVRMRLMFDCVLDRIVLTPIEERHQGERMEIFLREDRWPDFWKLANG
ncbi:recombinase family protein [Magnetospirillum sp. 15-1]|uniref:recombinase family protein n=1 Tax=Magnetospirillum sp. 15-1 TaxID=1979370 RepID=UPI000BBC2BC6|nr:recombinase family protein [Magnetospirillum sp. 15-1]